MQPIGVLWEDGQTIALLGDAVKDKRKQQREETTLLNALNKLATTKRASLRRVTIIFVSSAAEVGTADIVFAWDDHWPWAMSHGPCDCMLFGTDVGGVS